MRAWVSVRKQVEALGVAKELAVVIQGTDDPVLCFQCPPPSPSHRTHTRARTRLVAPWKVLWLMHYFMKRLGSALHLTVDG